MKKIVLVYGSIAGSVVAAMGVITTAIYCNSGDFSNGMIVGYTSMIIAFSMVFVGVKVFRDKYNGGVISFGKAFKVGILITLLASTFYVVTWLINYTFFVPDFGTKYAAHVIDGLKASGATQAEITKQSDELAHFAEMYKNPFFNAAMTYMEILPVGLLVTLISAFALKRKPVNN
ncbi:DUF4199 domain-containing protein [Sediminibacterium roseum]|uniref:DUF4199 domain-containing protein n=1 Tax=Sediminibacterium roseum TaxID=1978412 RepID=A0ABW9ZYY1_9BACT|nr:DUF4199 domain-containing protein [Sediminibacterium roseum]NCI50408.1 DUF4199 domain-containing protein [Sediminibacterium roseum]